VNRAHRFIQFFTRQANKWIFGGSEVFGFSGGADSKRTGAVMSRPGKCCTIYAPYTLSSKACYISCSSSALKIFLARNTCFRKKTNSDQLLNADGL